MKSKSFLYSFILIASFIILLCTVSSVNVASSKGVSLFPLGENYTYINKPVYPMKINASQIPIGGRWTFIYYLNKGSRYHIYFIGDWLGSKTDYDVYVYDPMGNLESVHTASAGLPEHLGNTVDDPFFTPERSGYYYFLIINDPRESCGEDAATFMVIEHLECNRWYERYIKGKVNFHNVFETTWAYEFTSNSERIEVWIDVPETLDMYEARLYLMANPSKGVGDLLNGYPLAWEPGLYGQTDSSKHYGGYNLKDEGFKNEEATASCEFFGQDMLINYTSPFKGETVLYHLVLIGENGKGTVKFMIKTDFEPPSINLQTNISKVHAGDKTVIKAEISDEDSLKSVLLYYTDDDWVSSHVVPMNKTSGDIYEGAIPPYPKGSKIKYKVVAVDMAGNTAEASGSYLVKDESAISLRLSKNIIYAGDKIMITGHASNCREIILNFTSQEGSILNTVQVNSDGSFSYEYAPNSVGTWTVTAIYPGDDMHFKTVTKKTFKVVKVPTSLDLGLSNDVIDIGGSINITGSISPLVKEKRVEVQFTMPNGTVIKKAAYTDSSGIFKLDFTPSMAGKWNIQAFFEGDDAYLPSSSSMEELIVKNTWMNMILSFINQFMMYIIASIGGTVSAVGFLIYWRRRE